jgi:hypothetical protein
MSKNIVSVYDLGELGYFMKAKPNSLDGGTRNEIKTRKTKMIWIVDRSGSMGSYVSGIVNIVIPTSMNELGYASNEIVSLITFDSETESHERTVLELNNMKIQQRGSTRMANVYSQLSYTLSKIDQETDVNIIAISDGEICDTETTIRESTKYSRLKRNMNINVLTIRLFTSDDASPDTRALACVGLFNTDGTVPIVDCKVKSYDVLPIINLIVSQSKKSPITHFVELRTKNNIIRTSVIAENTNKVLLRCDQWNNIILDNIDDPIYLENQLLNIDPIPLESEDNIKDFIGTTTQWLKIRNVVGLEQPQEKQKIIKWFENLRKFLEKNISTTLNEDSVMSVDLRSRVREMKKKLHRRGKSILNELLESTNQSKLDNLNSKQLAEYLRSDVSCKRTAKRMENNDPENKIVEDILKEINKIKNFVPKRKYDEDEVSFLSRADPSESILEISDLIGTDLELSDILQLTGFIGVCFNGKKGDLPDPWRFAVNEVFCGNYYLSEEDLRTMDTLQYPGTNRNINGVVPLRMFCPELYDKYCFGGLKKLAEYHAGVTIRSVIGTIPFDILAMNVAVLRNIFETLGWKNQPSEIQRKIIDSLIDGIHMHYNKYADNIFSDISKLMMCNDPRIHMNGATESNSVLKLFSIVMFSKQCCAMRSNDIQLWRFICCLFDLDTYMKAKSIYHDHHENRSTDLDRLLGIDFERFRNETQITNSDQADFDSIDLNKFYGNIEESYEKLPDWLPSIDKYISLFKWIRGGEPLEIETLSACNIQDENYISILKLGCCCNAIRCAYEFDRFDKENNVVNSPHPDNIYDILSWIRNFQTEKLKMDYQDRLKQKKEEERKIELERNILRIISCDNEIDFVRILEEANIKNRCSDGYTKLIDLLVEKYDMGNDWKNKVKILLTGRDSRECIVWCGGNVAGKNDVEKFEYLFECLSENSFWSQISETIRLNKKWTYRNNGQLNRHGHSNDNPSFFGLGFDSLEDFKSACLGGNIYTMSDWHIYTRRHANCCGLNLSN